MNRNWRGHLRGRREFGKCIVVAVVVAAVAKPRRKWWRVRDSKPGADPSNWPPAPCPTPHETESAAPIAPEAAFSCLGQVAASSDVERTGRVVRPRAQASRSSKR
jgi:hypothetical protein